MQLLAQGKCLLIFDDRRGYVKIFLESLHEMDSAIRRSSEQRTEKKQLPTDKLGAEFILAYDETKRMLAVCGTLEVRSQPSSFQQPTNNLYS